MGGHLNIAGQEYRLVWLHDSDPTPVGMDADDQGWTDYNSGIIYVRVQACSSRNHGTKVHEILHAALDASGAEWFIGELATKAGMDTDFALETVVRMLAPALVSVVI
jgi:hypothetical protein